ncbi:MAG: Ig-like domain-containing domain [Candidatus Marinimicrobia bacterium]|nr:Ig-like domain-containing domain [Candidatus Neomarinimicrobiota bacterium]
MKKKLLFTTFFIVFIFSLYNCASQGRPGGGPKDTTPPVVYPIYVKDGTTKLNRTTKIIFNLSEKINKLSAKKAITIFPLNLTDYSIDVRKRTIIITPESKWKKNQFYTIIIDRNLSDLRNNKIKQPITLSFSTGTKIPQGSLQGQVYGLKEKDNAIIIFSSNTKSIDSLFKNYEYFSQPNENGNFNFNYLPSKEFTILGFIDNDNNKKYEAKFDDLILPNTLFFSVNDSTIENLEFDVIRGNFSIPRLLSIENIYQNKTELTFSKSISALNNNSNFIINGNSINHFLAEDDKVTIIHNFIDDDSATILIENLKDDLNNILPDTSIKFAVNTFSDSTYSLQFKNKNLIITPPLDTNSILGTLISGNDTTSEKLQQTYLGTYKFDEKYENKSIKGNLKIKLPKNKKYSFLDSDSIYNVRINQFVNTDSGRVIGKMQFIPNITLILSNDKFHLQVKPKMNNNFTFKNLPSGKYQLYYYIDKNSNGRIDRGNINPFESPEIKKLLLDKIEVRAHWDTDIGLIKI